MAVALHAFTLAWSLDAGARISFRTPDPSAIAALWPLSILDLARAEQWSTEAGWSEEQLRSVYGHLFRRGGDFTPTALHEQAGLSRASAEAMCENFVALRSRIVERIPSEGGMKLVVELQPSGQRVEMAMILHDHKTSGKRRCTVCVSSQVGCKRACSFCETGTMGLRGNLGAADILEQVWHARTAVPDGYEVRNVVYMGMGEPLDNFDAVLASLRGLTHQALFDLSAKHLTVSTVGASPDRIKQLADTAPKVRLALSLHSASLPLRLQLIPSATAMPDLTDALDYHSRVTRCGLMIEYLLIAGVNDRADDADALAHFCGERDVAAARVSPPLSRKQARAAAGYVNLIPFNPTGAGNAHGYETPSDAAVSAFHARLRDVHGVHALIRWTSASGRDANGACGQLVTSHRATSTASSSRSAVTGASSSRGASVRMSLLDGALDGWQTTIEGVKTTVKGIQQEYGQEVPEGYVAASHILFLASDDAERKAAALKSRVEAGELSFGEAALRFSYCPTRDLNGSLGTFTSLAALGEGTLRGGSMPYDGDVESAKPFDQLVHDRSTGLGTIHTVVTTWGTHLVLVEARAGEEQVDSVVAQAAELVGQAFEAGRDTATAQTRQRQQTAASKTGFGTAALGGTKAKPSRPKRSQRNPKRK